MLNLFTLRNQERRNHENMILINLIVVEIFMSVIRVIYFALFLGNHNTYTNSVWFFQIIGHCTLLAYVFLMISITLDRLAMSIISIRYQFIITQGSVVIILACCWILGPNFSLLLYLPDKYELHQNIHPKIIFPVIE